MTLPQNVADALSRVQMMADSESEWADIDIADWQTIRAHLMSQEAEISNLRADRDSWLDQASQRVEDWDDMRRRAESAESRFAAANALLREIYAGDDLEQPARRNEALDRIQSHLQGAGDEA